MNAEMIKGNGLFPRITKSKSRLVTVLSQGQNVLAYWFEVPDGGGYICVARDDATPVFIAATSAEEVLELLYEVAIAQLNGKSAKRFLAIGQNGTESRVMYI